MIKNWIHQFDSKSSWEASPLYYIRIILQKAYKSAFLVRFGVPWILHIHQVPWWHGYGRNVAKINSFLQDDPNLPKREAHKLWFKLEASLEVCYMSCTQQECNWDDQNMVEITQVFLQWYKCTKIESSWWWRHGNEAKNATFSVLHTYSFLYHVALSMQRVLICFCSFSYQILYVLMGICGIMKY